MSQRIGQLLGATGSETLTNLVGREQQGQEAGQRSQRQFAVIDRFYTALRAIYGSKFDQQFTSSQDVAESKAMWGSEIADKTDQQLMGCINNCKARVRAGDADWLWPNIGLVLGYVDNSWQHKASRIDYTGHVQLEDLTAKQEKKDHGRSMLAKLRQECGI